MGDNLAGKLVTADSRECGWRHDACGVDCVGVAVGGSENSYQYVLFGDVFGYWAVIFEDIGFIECRQHLSPHVGGGLIELA